MLWTWFYQSNQTLSNQIHLHMKRFNWETDSVNAKRYSFDEDLNRCKIQDARHKRMLICWNLIGNEIENTAK